MATFPSFSATRTAPQEYRGNPNVTITAIDGGITLSRTSGSTPAFVQVSASAITATGTDYPYRDLEYRWDFGDPSGGENFTNPVTGGSENANQQRGPEAAYVYRTAGTYTIQLRIRGKNGSGYTEVVKNATFTVSTFSPSNGHWYFDSNAADGGDGSEGSPFNDYTNLKNKANLSGTALHLKRGSTFVSTTAHIPGQSNTRIDAYGTGAMPIIDGSNVSQTPSHGTLWFTNQFVNNDDFVMSNVEITNSTGYDVRFESQDGWGLDTTNVYFDNCKFKFIRWTNSSDNGDEFYNHGMWGHQCLQPIGAVGVSNTFALGSAVTWQFFFGCLITADSAKVWSVATDHWIYPNTTDHMLYKWTEFGDGNSWYAINGNVHGTAEEHRAYHVISECAIHGCSAAIELSVSQPPPGADTAKFENAVIEGNLIYNQTNDNAISIIMCYSAVVRDNYIGTTTANYCSAVSNNSSSVFAGEFYRNKCYYTSSGFGMGATDYPDRMQISDNILWSPNSGVIGMQVNSSAAAWTNPGSIIDRNQYYFPSDTTYNSLNGGSTFVNFATWQAGGFDANGEQLVSAPSWPDPANGDFGQ
jgi:hypothetical protein